VLFNSWTFFFFFAAFIPFYLLVRNNVTQRNILLLGSSYIFYGFWDSRFLILVAVSTSVDYLAALGAAGKTVTWVDRAKAGGFLLATTVVALAFTNYQEIWIFSLVSLGIVFLGAASAIIERFEPSRRRVAWLWVSLVTDLGILGVFKYFNFFVASLDGLLSLFNLDPIFLHLSIILPVGLSFYTFQAISRTIDSYRGAFDPSKRLIDYAAYHAFFPQLVAGPIERASNLMPQFEKVLPINSTMILTGAFLFLWGLYKKMVIADRVAPLADAVFNNAQAPGDYVTAVLAFSFQIYCDFSGYSDMARGLARSMGFTLVNNFNLPYFSRTPSEFWQRWHISLSGWLRDYLYIPLGGNRGGEWRTYRNLLATMLLGGLWHGAAWTFIAWGGIHGIILVIYRIMRVDHAVTRINPTTMAGAVLNVVAWMVMQLLVLASWVFFRARTFGDAIAVLKGSVGVTEHTNFQTFWMLMFYVWPLVVAEIYQRFSSDIEFYSRGPFLWRYSVAMAMILAIVVLGSDGGQKFIYFDF
jgi:alginate O-acetyltransferase complex protein AlgI